jgi:O-antigen ligase
MGIGLISGQEFIRTTGTRGNSNSLAIALVFSIPCLLYAAEKKIISPKLCTASFILITTGVICTVSRKGLIALVLSIILYYFLSKRYKRVLALIIGIAIVSVLLSGVSTVSHRFEKDELEFHLSGKWAMTLAGWDMFLNNPGAGLGYKGYYDNFRKYFPYSPYKKYDAHNIFITALANYGLLGFLPFIGIFLYPLLLAFKSLRNQNRDPSGLNTSGFAKIAICSIIPFMVYGSGAGGGFQNTVSVSLLYSNAALFLANRNLDKMLLNNVE